MKVSLRTNKNLSYACAFLTALFFAGISYSFAAPEDSTLIENRAERRVALENVIQERIINLASNVTLRFKAATRRLGNIIARLETRIVKLESLGVDTTNATNTLNDAKEILVRTVIALDTMSSVKNAVSSDTPQESFQNIRGEFIAVRDDLKQVRELLRVVIVLLKEAIAVRDGSTAIPDISTEATLQSTTTTEIQ